MNTESLKSDLYQAISQIQDEEILAHYLQVIQSSQRFFGLSESDLIHRTEASIRSIDAGNTRSLQSFTNDFGNWKKRNSK